MNKKITCLIVDDEPPALDILREYIGAISSLELAGACTNAIQALDILRRRQIDLLFLDIQMPQILGTDFVRSLKQRPAIIFTTAYRKFAVEGFELNAVDYLLKPIPFERFLMAVNRILDQQTTAPATNLPATTASHPPETLPPTENYIHLRVDRKTQKIRLDGIIYIESLKDYARIVTTEGKYITKQPISSIEGLLPANAFLRIHRSYIVSLDKINSYTHELVELPGAELPIGRNYRHEVEKLLRF